MAITKQDRVLGTSAFPPAATAFNTPCSIGDVLICMIELNSSSSPGTTTVSDNVNSGNYTLLNFHLDTGSASSFGIYFKVANAAGTPTVSASLASSQFGALEISRFNGFVGTPTPDATINASGPFVATGTTAISCSPITTNFNNELLLTCQGFNPTNTYTTPTISGWTALDGGTFGSPSYYAVEVSSGTTNNFVGTYGASTSWQNVFAGIYDAPNSGISVAWWV